MHYKDRLHRKCYFSLLSYPDLNQRFVATLMFLSSDCNAFTVSLLNKIVVEEIQQHRFLVVATATMMMEVP